MVNMSDAENILGKQIVGLELFSTISRKNRKNVFEIIAFEV
jgi:hypothetical protein